MSDEKSEMVERARDGFGRAAAGWDRWADLIGQRDDAARYVEAAGVRPGHRVLEIGAGTGEQTLALARAVGPDGAVLATDLTEQMLAVARRRTRAAGLDNIRFQTLDASELDLDEDGFDAAVSGLTWMFLPDPVHSASRVRELLKPDGRFAASVWGPPSEVPMVSVAMAAAVREMRIDPHTADAGTAPDLSGAGVFRDVLIGAGFGNVSVDAFTISLTWQSPDQYGEWIRDVFVDLDGLAEQALDGTEAVYAAIVEAVRDHTTADGTLTFDNLALMGTAERPV